MWTFIISDHPRMNGLCVRIVIDRDVDMCTYTYTHRILSIKSPAVQLLSSTAVGHGLKDHCMPAVNVH